MARVRKWKESETERWRWEKEHSRQEESEKKSENDEAVCCNLHFFGWATLWCVCRRQLPPVYSRCYFGIWNHGFCSKNGCPECGMMAADENTHSSSTFYDLKKCSVQIGTDIPRCSQANLISFHGTDSAQHLSKNPLMRKLDPIGKKVTNEISLKRQAFLLDSNEINGRVNGDVYLSLLLLRFFPWEKDSRLSTAFALGCRFSIGH